MILPEFLVVSVFDKFNVRNIMKRNHTCRLIVKCQNLLTIVEQNHQVDGQNAKPLVEGINSGSSGYKSIVPSCIKIQCETE